MPSRSHNFYRVATDLHIGQGLAVEPDYVRGNNANHVGNSVGIDYPIGGRWFDANETGTRRGAGNNEKQE